MWITWYPLSEVVQKFYLWICEYRRLVLWLFLVSWCLLGKQKTDKRGVGNKAVGWRQTMSFIDNKWKHGSLPLRRWKKAHRFWLSNKRIFWLFYSVPTSHCIADSSTSSITAGKHFTLPVSKNRPLRYYLLIVGEMFDSGWESSAQFLQKQ